MMVTVFNKKDNVLGCWLFYISDWHICVKATCEYNHSYVNVILYPIKSDNPDV